MSYLAKTVLLDQAIGEDTFNLDFTYTDQTEVRVKVGLNETTAFTWVNSSTIQLDTPLVEVSDVVLYRDTNLSERRVDFQNTAELDEIDLDNANIQVFNKMQELTDTQEDKVQREPDGSIDMEGKRIVQVADPVDDTDAVNKQSMLSLTSSQVAAAQAAQTAAQTAQAGAELAEDGADASALAASMSASNASTSESNAAGSASAAATSEANAELAEDDAVAARLAAEAAQTAAATAETAAAGRAAAAATN
mgnify:FL=1